MSVSHYQHRFQDSFEHLRTTNGVPTKAEGKNIASIVDSISAELCLVDAALRQFQEERKVLHDAAQRFARLRSSRRRLPPEVLCEIFRTACRDVYEPDNKEFEKDDEDDETHDDDDTGDEKAGAILDPKSPYWTLTRVCRVWRDVMLSDASIWAKLHFRIYRLGHVYIQRDFETPVLTALSRARQNPLDISFDISSTSGVIEPTPEMRALREKRQRAVFGRICAAAEQWTRASLTLSVLSQERVPSLLQRYGIPSMVHNRLVLLEQLTLVAAGHPWFISPSDRLGFGLCPSLRRVTLKNAFCADLPWQQITHLHIETFREQDDGHARSYLDVIRSCRVLRALKIRTRYFEIFRGTPVNIPTLRSLDTNFCDIVHALVVPNLVELSVPNCKWDDELRVDSGLVSLIGRSKCSASLTCLRLIGVTLSNPLDSTFTQALTNLEHFATSADLDIFEEDADPHLLNTVLLLRRLTPPDIIWPKLRTLSIDVSGYPNGSDHNICMRGDGLNRMLKYRSQPRPTGAVRLESFRLNVEADELDDLDVSATVNLKELEKLRDGGMDLRICVKTRYAMEGQIYTRLSFGQ
ncbi:hypothetical protein BDZ89DRAFT_1067405 [Hymenopellis radicata]|nr:hypothetical protein BDZ89DRAFT_1067405 [Hymenopellis radicata]